MRATDASSVTPAAHMSRKAAGSSLRRVCLAPETGALDLSDACADSFPEGSVVRAGGAISCMPVWVSEV